MSTQLPDPLVALLEVVRNAAREGAEQALAVRRPAALEPPGPLLDKRGIAHALGVSLATIDRLCRDGRIPFLRVGDARRFDLVGVRAALEEGDDVARSGASARPTPKPASLAGVRLLSRSSR